MKLFYIALSLFCYFHSSVSAQTALQWQKSLGGKTSDYAYASTPTSDGGYVIVGSTTNNNDGDVPASKAFNGNGGNDIWVVKVNNWGEVVWSKTFGGSKDDFATDVLETTDKSLLIMAMTASNDGDAQGNGSRGGLLLLKLKPDGSLLSRKVFASGYNVGEIAFVRPDAYSKPSIKPTIDGAYIIGANILPLNNSDFWLAKVTDTGTVFWTKTFGSNQNDWMNEVVVCADGGYLMLGGTEANANEITGAGKGFIDTYAVKVDATGNLLWQRAWGGSNLDQAFSGLQNADGSFLIVGETSSVDGDFNGNLGQKDGFVLKISNEGNVLWRKQVGGTDVDGLYTIRQAIGGKIYAMGQSNSTIGTVKPKGPVGDVWIVHIDPNGTIDDHKLMGGADVDIARNAFATADGGFIIAANSDSVDGDLTQNNGSTDFWLIKVGSLLPVTLRSFSAELTNEQYVKLSWTSLNETKSKNFVIERSFDQIKFTALGTINASGNASTSKAYSFTDMKPIFGRNYYRLKFYDETGKEFTYKTVSAVVSLLPTENPVDNSFSVFPNPVTESIFYVNTPENLSGRYALINQQGHNMAIETQPISTSQHKVLVKQHLNAGVYFFAIDLNGHKIIKKVIVE
ncbi:T9SS type A sorting domain-containing protein [Emticicia sp. 17c]|uniref:T9SS type A sorting domain-containing protein n=1 Tax=Emticicia sp. 17c TaxID=3127704 RepID=UPI00301D5502